MMTMDREQRLLLDRNVMESFINHPGANVSLEEIGSTWLKGWKADDLQESLQSLVVCGVLAKYGRRGHEIYYAPESYVLQVALNLFASWVYPLR